MLNGSVYISITHMHKRKIQFNFTFVFMYIASYSTLYTKTNLFLPRVTIVDVGCSRGIFFIGAGMTFFICAACDNITDGTTDLLQP